MNIFIGLQICCTYLVYYQSSLVLILSFNCHPYCLCVIVIANLLNYYFFGSNILSYFKRSKSLVSTDYFFFFTTFTLLFLISWNIFEIFELKNPCSSNLLLFLLLLFLFKNFLCLWLSYRKKILKNPYFKKNCTSKIQKPKLDFTIRIKNKKKVITFYVTS